MDLSACIFWGAAGSQSDVSIQNLSIHGVSFRSKKYFTEGAQFQMILPRQWKGSERGKIQAKVVRCKTLNGFSSDGKFEVGAQFLFKSNRPKKYEENSIPGTLSSLQSNGVQSPALESIIGGLKNYREQTSTKRMQGPLAIRIGVREVNANLIHSVRTSTKEETVITSIQIKQARISLLPPSSSSGLALSVEPLEGVANNPSVANLVCQNFPAKR